MVKKAFLLAIALTLLPMGAVALEKDVAGQTISVHLWDSAGGDVTTGTTTCYVVADGGTESAGAVAVHEGHGTWSYAITQAETNGDHIAVTCENSNGVTGAVQTYTIPNFALFARDSTLLSAISEGILINQPTVKGDITVYSDKVKTLTLNLGTDYNLTSKKVYFTAKENKTDAIGTAQINLECTVTDAANGVATCSLTTTHTDTVGRYFYEVTVTDSDGTSNPLAAQVGVITVAQSVR